MHGYVYEYLHAWMAAFICSIPGYERTGDYDWPLFLLIWSLPPPVLPLDAQLHGCSVCMVGYCSLLSYAPLLL